MKTYVGIFTKTVYQNIFFLLHVNTTDHNWLINMTAASSAKDQRTSAKRRSKWLHVPMCKYVVKKPTPVN